MAPTHAPMIWMDGAFLPWAEATTHVMSHALHYGSGVFEGIKCYCTDDGPAIFRLEDHIQRLFDSARLYNMKIPYQVRELVQASVEVVKANELESAYIRPIAFYGYESLGVRAKDCPIHVAIACFNWGAYLGEEGLAKGVRITVSPWKKFSSSSFPSIAKGCGQYLNSMLAVNDAHKRDFDEALLLNMDGNIAEGSGQNLFVVKHGSLFTNDEKASILLGITRDTTIKIAEDLGINVKIGDLTIDQLLDADEAFFTGTASEVTPIRELDGQTIGNGKPGRLTVQLRALYFDIVKGKNSKYRHWLTYV